MLAAAIFVVGVVAEVILLPLAPVVSPVAGVNGSGSAGFGNWTSSALSLQVDFVSVVWFLGVSGIALSLGPFVAITLATFTAAVIAAYLELPLLARQAMEGVAWLCVALGADYYGSTHFQRVFTSLLAWFLCAICSSFSLRLWENSNKIRSARDVIGGLLAVAGGLLAWRYQSEILGFVAAGTAWSVLGFGTSTHGLTTYIGFENATELVRCMLVSLLVLMFAFPALWLGHNLAPFANGIFFFGNFCFSVAVDIYQYNNSSFKAFWMVAGLSFFLQIALGAALNERYTFYTGLFFLYLWYMQNVITVPDKAVAYAMVFGSSVVLYLWAAWMDRNPWFVQMVGVKV